ncbi:MAG: hypothetical protein R3E96_13295 [Planctomycetota bacterium]
MWNAKSCPWTCSWWARVRPAWRGAIYLDRSLKQKGIEDKTILVIDKAEELGHHTLSGAVMDPRGMAELFPDWKEKGLPGLHGCERRLGRDACARAAGRSR